MKQAKMFQHHPADIKQKVLALSSYNISFLSLLPFTYLQSLRIPEDDIKLSGEKETNYTMVCTIIIDDNTK